MEPLDDIVRTALQTYMIPGTHIAVNECIQGFQGRASKIVTIPSTVIRKRSFNRAKPTNSPHRTPPKFV